MASRDAARHPVEKPFPKLDQLHVFVLCVAQLMTRYVNVLRKKGLCEIVSGVETRNGSPVEALGTQRPLHASLQGSSLSP